MMTTPCPIVFLNGEFIKLDDAHISPLDRAFLFGDAIYEVVPVYDSEPFLIDAHLVRLEHSLGAINLQNPYAPERWLEILAELARLNGGGDLLLYFQISRGADSGRDHPFPDGIEPTVFAMTQPFHGIAKEKLEQGLKIVILNDTRWARCDIKTTSLIANVVLRQQAQNDGADEAVLIHDGCITEGTSSSVFAVIDDLLVTPPKSHRRLPGTTRDLVLELATEVGIDYRECEIAADDFRLAQEIWLSSAAREVVPVTAIDGRPVGDGRPGPDWRRVYARYQARKAARTAPVS